jgi:8-oxo-dGTP pyrophosphatase MutT (NUDIX family)
MKIITEFTERLEIALNEAVASDYASAVGIVTCGDKYLLGLARNTGDDRSGKWVFPGGHVKRGEKPSKAAEREVWEEAGIRCKATGEPISYGRKNVAFFKCTARSGQRFKHNHEFSAMGWFTKREMRALKLYDNVLKLIEKL